MKKSLCAAAFLFAAALPCGRAARADDAGQPGQVDVDAMEKQYKNMPGGEAIVQQLEAHRADIDRLFAGESVEAIVEALRADGGAWATAQAGVLETKSPQTLKVAFRQLALGAELTSFADNMALEDRIGSKVVQMPDFIEGVRAVIVDKDNAPRWTPPTLQAVTPAILEAIFAPLARDDEWTPLPETAS